MREMKDSGIEWIGDIPKDWDSKPIYTLFEEIVDKNYKGDVTNALKFTYGDIVRKQNFDADEDDYVANTILNYTIVTPGTIMLNGLNLNYDFISQRVGLVKEKGVITSAYMAFKPNKLNAINSEFATYLFKAYDGCKAFHNMGGGVRKILNFSELKKYYVPFPSINEQERIVSVLNQKSLEIDIVSEDIQKQITVLEDYKKSVITEAVTKGINPNVEMKDSGIDWIGKIPKNWSVNKMKFLGHFTNGFAFPSHSFVNDGVLVMKISNIQPGYIDWTDSSYVDNIWVDKVKDCVVKKNDLVFALTRPVINGGIKVAIYSEAHAVLLNQRNALFRSTKEIMAKWLYYVMQNTNYIQEFMLFIDGTGQQPNISTNEIAEISIPFIELKEQELIVRYLDEKCFEIDTLISDKKKQLEILADYKKSLIYEYITGKKEVPES